MHGVAAPSSVLSEQRPYGAFGIKKWTGTLTAPGVDFDVTRPTLTGVTNKTVRARKGTKSAPRGLQGRRAGRPRWHAAGRVHAEVRKPFQDRQDARDLRVDRQQREHSEGVVHGHRQADDVTPRVAVPRRPASGGPSSFCRSARRDRPALDRRAREAARRGFLPARAADRRALWMIVSRWGIVSAGTFVTGRRRSRAGSPRSSSSTRRASSSTSSSRSGTPAETPDPAGSRPTSTGDALEELGRPRSGEAHDRGIQRAESHHEPRKPIVGDYGKKPEGAEIENRSKPDRRQEPDLEVSTFRPDCKHQRLSRHRSTV